MSYLLSSLLSTSVSGNAQTKVAIDMNAREYPHCSSAKNLSAQATVGLSLILATLGRTFELGRFFESIRDSHAMPLEIIVVDQNLDDRLADFIENAIASGLVVRHLRIAPRKGLSLARNEGLKIARYSIVGFPDDDCWYEAGVCRRVIEKFSCDVSITGVVARWLDRHRTNDCAVILNPILQRKFSGIPIASICLFFRTEDILAAGGFDERLGVGTWAGSSEETDLAFCLLGAGKKLVFFPDIVVRHHWVGTAIPVAGSFSSVLREAVLRARGTGVIYAKHTLEDTVVLRGLLAPLLRVVDPRSGLRGAAYWLGTSLGRWQGYMKWRKLRP